MTRPHRRIDQAHGPKHISEALFQVMDKALDGLPRPASEKVDAFMSARAAASLARVPAVLVVAMIEVGMIQTVVVNKRVCVNLADVERFLQGRTTEP